MLFGEDEEFGECGLQDCDECAAFSTCLAAKPKKRRKRAKSVCPGGLKKKVKYGTKKYRAYKIVRVSKGRVIIRKAGWYRCRSRTPLKKVAPAVPTSSW